MANKKINIGSKPTGKLEDPNQWVLQGQESYEKTEDVQKNRVKMKRLTLDIPEELHRAIKTKAVANGVAMADMLRELLQIKYGNNDFQK